MSSRNVASVALKLLDQQQMLNRIAWNNMENWSRGTEGLERMYRASGIMATVGAAYESMPHIAHVACGLDDEPADSAPAMLISQCRIAQRLIGDLNIFEPWHPDGYATDDHWADGDAAMRHAWTDLCDVLAKVVHERPRYGRMTPRGPRQRLPIHSAFLNHARAATGLRAIFAKRSSAEKIRWEWDGIVRYVMGHEIGFERRVTATKKDKGQ